MQIKLDIPDGAFKALLRSNPSLIALIKEGKFDPQNVGNGDAHAADQRAVATAFMQAVAHIVTEGVKNPKEQQSVITAALRKVERRRPKSLRGSAGEPLLG